MFVGAHADDVELGAGGTCVYLRSLGFNVHILIMSDEDCQTVAARRRAEARAAGAVLGVRSEHVHFLGLADGAMVCNRQSVGALRTLVARLGVDPMAVFTHTEADSHQDHITTTAIVKGAFRKTALFKYQVRNSVVTSSFAPIIHCAIDRTYDVKLRALGQYQSQVEAGRIPMDEVARFDERAGTASSGRYGEAFELDIQNGAAGHTELIGLIDSQPFRQLWAPVLATGGLTVLAAPERRAGSSTASDLVLVTRLQERLARSRAIGVGAHHPFRFDVALSEGATDAARVAAGNTLILGGPDINPAAAALQLWLGAPMQSKSDTQGLLTIACNPLKVRRDGSAFIFCVSGTDDETAAAAAECLLHDERIKSIMARVQSVYRGEATWVQIPVPTSNAHDRITTSSRHAWEPWWAGVEQHEHLDRGVRA